MRGPQFDPPMLNGNPATPTNLQSVPIVVVTGSTEVSVDTLKECGGGECIPNLNVQMVNISYE